MTEQASTQRRDEAIEWIIRLREGLDGDAIQLVEWLERSPENRAAFNDAALADSDGGAVAAPIRSLVADNDDRPERPGRRWAIAAIGTAVAASLAMILVAPRPVSDRVITTARGEQRTITLTDGSRIALNGSTSVTIDGDDERLISLQSGQAYFNVRHDADHPFRVRVGDETVEDLGTEFEIVRTSDQLSLAVAQGSVAFRQAEREVALGAGDRLDELDGRYRLTRDARTTMAGWRTGQFSFTNAPLAVVVGEVARTRGYDLRVSPQIAHRSFTGIVVLSPNEDEAVRKLAKLLGVGAAKSGSSWQLGPGARATN